MITAELDRTAADALHRVEHCLALLLTHGLAEDADLADADQFVERMQKKADAIKADSSVTKFTR